MIKRRARIAPGRPHRAGTAVGAIAPAVVLMGALALAPASTAAGRANPTKAAPSSYVANQLLVRFGPGVDQAAAARLDAGMQARTLKVFPFVPGLQLVELTPGAGVPAAAASFSALPQVRYAQPNWVSHIDIDSPAGVDRTPNDPRYPSQWDWPRIDAPAAWDRTTGSKKIVVGDIDTGIDYTHVDLKKNVWKNTAECKGTPGVDDDHNGYVDDCHGIDTINGDSNPRDDNDHGSHTGGTIGAVGNNGTGVTGLNWRIRVLPCKSHDSAGNGSIASIIECYQYMVTEKAAGYDIISTNNSYGGCPEACGFDQATMDGIAAMNEAGILFAVAAGNNASDNDRKPVYPANYFLPNVITVAATNSADGLPGFSDYGARSVLVGAPGQSVLSTVRNNAYASFSGTSMATPHVAGLAALIHAFDPGLNIYQIRNLIVSSGDDVPSLATKTVSGKRINAGTALACSGSNVFGMLRPLDVVPAGTLTIAAINIDCDAPAGGVTVKIKPGNVTLTLKDRGRKADLQSRDGIYSAFWHAAPGTYTLKFSTGTAYSVSVS